MVDSQLLAGSDAAFTGFWTDFGGGGRVRGATLTLRNRDATILLSFLAVLVGLRANRSWKIWRLILVAKGHGLQSLSQLRKELQVILRNSETTGATISALFALLRTPSELVNRSDRLRSIALVAVAALHMVLFLAAGIMTSQIVFGRVVTSRVTPSCGQWLPKLDTNVSRGLVGVELLLNQSINADNYVRNCYPMGVSRNMLPCDTMISSHLTFEERHDVSCPFPSGICRNGTNSAFEMTSGNISLSGLGVNSRYSRHMSMAKRSICAAVNGTGFLSRSLNSSQLPILPPGEFLNGYSVGTLVDGSDITRSYRYGEYTRSGYTLDAIKLSSAITNRSALLRTERERSDISLLLPTGHSITYTNVSDDPWFSAHREIRIDPTFRATFGDPELYGIDYVVSVLACDEQIRMCNALSEKCTDWGAPNDFRLENSLAMLPPGVERSSAAYNETQTIVELMFQTMAYSLLAKAVGTRGVSALQVTRYLNSWTQLQVNPEQWKVELRYWFSVTLARLQLNIFDTIERSLDVDPERTFNLWEESGLDVYCGRIKFRSASHTSMSTTGIAVVVAVAVILLLGSYVELALDVVLRKWSGAFIRKWGSMESVALFHEIGRLSQSNHSDLEGKADKSG